MATTSVFLSKDSLIRLELLLTKVKKRRRINKPSRTIFWEPGYEGEIPTMLNSEAIIFSTEPISELLLEYLKQKLINKGMTPVAVIYPDSKNIEQILEDIL